MAIEKPFLEISDRVKCCAGEQGLFSVAFPPGFSSKRYFYVSYTSQPRGGNDPGTAGKVLVDQALVGNTMARTIEHQHILVAVDELGDTRERQRERMRRSGCIRLLE